MGKIYKVTDPAGKATDLPLREGTLGPGTLDIGALYKEQGAFTFDPEIGRASWWGRV